MESKNTAYEYLPLSRASSHSEKKQDDDGSVLYTQNESRIRLIKRTGKGGLPKSLKEDEHIRPPTKLRNSRIVRLVIFLVLEVIWLGFGLFVYFRPIITPSGNISVGKISTSSASLFEAAFGSFGILWQSFGSFTIADVVQEIYSGEWHEMAKRQMEDQGRTIRDMETVSTLVSGRILQARHAFRSGYSTLRYRLAVIISLLLIALSALAPNAIRISSVSSERPLMIGAITYDVTEDWDDLLPVSPNMTYEQLLSEVIQFEYVTLLDGSPPEFIIKDASGNTPSNVLFGMPLRSELGDTAEITRLSYISDAVFYNYTCQWLAPAPTPNGYMTWNFGGDMEGTIDQSAEYASDSRTPITGYFGIFPLNITSGAGARNGSLAWFISSFLNYTTIAWNNGHPTLFTNDVFVDLSFIPKSERTFGNATYLLGDTEFTEIPNLNFTTTDTVLFCDPHVQMDTVEVDMSNDGSTLTFRPLGGNGSATVGNMDHIYASQAIGRGLNGIPWEPNVVMYGDGIPSGSTLGQLTAKLLFLPPVQKTTQQPNGSPIYTPWDQTIYIPQSLSDISSNFNSFTSMAGMNTYLSGSLGNYTVPTTGIYASQRLVVNWPQWFMNLSIVLVIAIFVISLTLRDARKRRELVPLTLGTVKKHLREYHSDLEE